MTSARRPLSRSRCKGIVDMLLRRRARLGGMRSARLVETIDQAIRWNA